MTKNTMIKWYRNKSAAEKYILGYVVDKKLYFSMVNEIMPRFLNVEQASRNQGDNLRLRLKKAHKNSLMKNSICLGSADLLNADKYNKGEIFEKLITEYFGQVWEKIPSHFGFKEISISTEQKFKSNSTERHL
jgi:hypothetical protein